MYGGHITDDWDRKLCRTYLEEFVKNEMLDGEFFLAPGFPIPPNTDYKVRFFSLKINYCQVSKNGVAVSLGHPRSWSL